VRREGLHTVCEEAGCPNISSAGDREATFSSVRPVHPALRLLPDRHGQAPALDTDERAGWRGRSRRWAGVRDRHRGRPGRSERRRRLAVRADGAEIHAAVPGCGRAADPDFNAEPTGCRGLQRAPRGARAQHRDVPRIFRSIRPGFRYKRSLNVLTRPRGRAGDQVQPDPGMAKAGRRSARPWPTCTRPAVTC